MVAKRWKKEAGRREEELYKYTVMNVLAGQAASWIG